MEGEGPPVCTVHGLPQAFFYSCHMLSAYIYTRNLPYFLTIHLLLLPFLCFATALVTFFNLQGLFCRFTGPADTVLNWIRICDIFILLSDIQCRFSDSQLSWVRSHHPPRQWNLRGGRWIKYWKKSVVWFALGSVLCKFREPNRCESKRIEISFLFKYM